MGIASQVQEDGVLGLRQRFSAFTARWKGRASQGRRSRRAVQCAVTQTLEWLEPRLFLDATTSPTPLFLRAERVSAVQAGITQTGSTIQLAYNALKTRVDNTRDDLTDLAAYNQTGQPRDYALGWFAREAAFVYRISGDAAYATAAYQALDRIYTSPDTDSRQLTNNSGISRAMQSVSFGLAYNWAWSGMTQTQRNFLWTRMISGLNTWATYSHSNLGSPWVSNHNAVDRGGEMILMLATDEMQNRLPRYSDIRGYLANHINTYGSKGWTQEGNGYLSYGGEFLVPAVLAMMERGDKSLLDDFNAHSPYQLLMYAGMFDAAQNSTQWGVGGFGFDPEGFSSALMGTIPQGDLGYYRWFYDRFRGVNNPAPASQKFDHARAGTVWALLYYPTNVAPVDPTATFSKLLVDSDGGYWMRNRWNNTGDTIVSLAADRVHAGSAWDEDDALQLNILANGTLWAGGPEKSTDSSLFSAVLVDGNARVDGTKTGALSFAAVNQKGAYAIASGGTKYTSLGLTSAHRHVLSDFSGTTSVISVLDKLRASAPHVYTWQLNINGLPATSGTEAGVPTFTVTNGNGGYMKGWVLTPGASISTGANVRVTLPSTSNADIWVVLATGTGTAPTAAISGSGLGATVTINGAAYTYTAGTDRLGSSAVGTLQAPPTPAFTVSPGAAPAPSAVSFNASGTTDADGDTLTYSWDFGDGTTGTGVSPSKTYTQNGTYIVQLRVSDGKGGVNTATKQVFVGNLSPVASMVTSATTGLPPLQVTFDATGSTDPEGDALTYLWKFGDGTTANTPTATHTYATTGNFDVQLIVTDTAGNWAAKGVTVRVSNSNPAARFTVNRLGGVVGESYTFNGTASSDPDGQALTYTWDFGNGVKMVNAASTVTYAYPAAGNFTPKLTVTDSMGATNTAQLDHIRVISATALSNPVDATGALPGLNYKHYVGDYDPLPNFNTLSPVRTGRVENISVVPTTAGSLYQFAYTGFITAPVDGDYVFKISSTAGSKLYIDGVLAVSADTWNYVDKWDTIGLKAGAHSFRYEYQYRDAGQYGNVAQEVDFWWQTPGSDEMVRVPSSAFSARVNLLNASFMASPVQGAGPLAVTFESTATDPAGGPLTYLWNFGDGTTSTAAKVTHTFTTNGSYPVTLTITDQNGASDIVGQIVTVTPDTMVGVDKTDEPGGIVTAQGQYSAKEGFVKAFDGASGTKWLDMAPTTWIQYQFTKNGVAQRHAINQYSITSANDFAGRDPKNWTLKGSNDGTNWTVLDTRTNEDFPRRYQTRYFNFTNVTPYSYYRFDITNDGEAATQLAEIQLIDNFTGNQPGGNTAPTNVNLVTSNTTGQGPLAVNFDLSSATDPNGDPLYYRWEFGDGQISDFSTSPTASHTYFTPGTYTAKGTVYDSQGAKVVTTRNVTVQAPSANAGPVPAFSTNVTSGPAKLYVTFDASATSDPDGDAMTYQWEFGDGFSGTGKTVSHHYDQAGTYTAVLVVTDARGRKAFATRQITASAPTAAANGVVSMNVTATLNDDRIPWNVGAGVVSVPNWNNAGANQTNLIDHRGAPTGISFTNAGTARVMTDVGTGSGDERLIYGSMGTTGSGARTYSFAGISYGTYDLYVYHGARGDNGTPVAYTVGNKTYYAVESDNVFDGTLSESTATTSAAAIEGNEYMVFRGLSGSSVNIVVTGGTRTGPAGFQIVATSGGVTNSPPTAANDTATTTRDTATTVNVLANDSDPNGDALSVSGVTQGAHGTVATNGTTVTYTPTLGYTGTDSFTYTIADGRGGTATGTVSVTINAPANNAPTAANDTAATAANTAVTVSVLANDSDPDGDTLTITGVTQGANGTVANNGGTVTYTPTAGYTGTDSFSYTIADGRGGTATATVNVTVTAQTPVLSINFGNNNLAAADTAGVVTRANWNNVGGASLAALVDSTGAATTAGVSTGGAYKYNTTDALTTGDYKMMSSFRGSISTSFTVTVSSLPTTFANYDVYVYWGAHDATATRSPSYTIGTQTFYLKDSAGTWDGTHDLSTASTAAAAVNGNNFVKFTGLSGSSFTLTIGPGGGGQRFGISGMQIVPAGTAMGGQANTLTATQDVGTTGTAGSASGSGGTYTVRGAGAGVTGTTDAFHYTYAALNGDGEFIARVSSVSTGVAGLMIRESLAANSAFASVAVSSSGSVLMQSRSSTGAAAITNASITSASTWLRITRTGNTIVTYYSLDGSNWIQAGSVQVTMAQQIYIGLYATSNVSGTLNTGVFESLTLVS